MINPLTPAQQALLAAANQAAGVPDALQAQGGGSYDTSSPGTPPSQADSGPGVLDAVGKVLPEPLAAAGGLAQGFGYDVQDPALQRAMGQSPGIAGAASVPGAALLGAGRLASKAAPAANTLGLLNSVTAPGSAAALLADRLFPAAPAPGSASSSSAPAAPGAPGTPPAPSQGQPAPGGQGGAPALPQAPQVRVPQVGSGELDAAGKQAMAAEAQAGKAAAAKDQAVGAEQGKQADLVGQFRQQYLQRAQELQAQGEARLQAMDKEIEGIGQGQRQVDPERWWKSRTEGQRISATISLALGGVASAFGAQNTGGKLIEDAIARDVDAQRFNIAQAAANKRDKLAAQQSAFGHFLQLTGNEQAAQSAAMAWGLKQADMKIEGLKASMAAPEDIARANAAQAQIRERITGEKAKLVELNSGLTTQALQQEGMRQQMAYQQAARQMLANGQVPPELRGQAVYDPESGRLLGLAPGEKEAEGARQMVGDSSGLLKEIEEAKRLAKEWGSSSNKTAAGAAYKAKLDAIVGKLNSAQGIQQAVGEEQRKLYMDTFGNETTTPTTATLAGLNGLAQTLRTNVNSRLRAFGPGMQPLYADPAQVGFKPLGGR